MSDPTTKRCTKCGEVKGIDDFAPRSDQTGKRKSYCRDCVRAWRAAYAAANPEKQKAAIAASRARNPLRVTWEGMIARCERPTHKHYKHYGGRGITVCTEWHEAAVFIAWIEANLGPRPEGHSLDRIDNDSGYRPGNVRWASAVEQQRNRRDRRKVES